MIKIRFVTGTDLVSRMISLQAGVAMPFAPTHTEALSWNGESYVGAHLEGGVCMRPVGYDADELITLPDGSKSERIVPIDCTPAQESAFHSFVESRIGTPYDWQAIVGFVDPEIHGHEFGHVICSAFMTQALRAAGFFPWPLAVPFHHISPRDLFLVLSSHVKIDH